MNDFCLRNDEKAIFALRSLYQGFGFRQYKMSKFEEYDLYINNKSFLVSDNIITFNDTDGRLLALKPDVTLSIIKNLKDEDFAVQKLYYNENVYRVSKGSHSFKEIMQTGLECIGNIDDYTIYEVLMLAAKSLSIISDDYVMDISHLGIVSALIDEVGASESTKKRIAGCLEDKNLSELSRIEKEESIDLAKLKQLIKTCGSLSRVLPFLNSLDLKDEVNQLVKIVSALENSGYKIRIDFSIISDMNYYNGFVFKGFINGVPSSILSGGQYDNLMLKMKRNKQAIGFAVYLDMLQGFFGTNKDFDVDIVLLYDRSCDISDVCKTYTLLSQNGSSVITQTEVPKKIRYKQLVRLGGKGVEILETNA